MKWCATLITCWQFRLGYHTPPPNHRVTVWSKAQRWLADALGTFNAIAARNLISTVTGSKRVLISMCTYQGEAWVEDAIRSVLELDYPNWHLYIVDDGSTDATTEMLKRWRRAHPDRITINLLPENSAPSNSINVSLRWFLAHPEFEVFHILDQDDILLPDGLHTGLELMGPHCFVVRCRNARYDAQLSEWFYDFAATAQLFVAREVIERIGLRTDRNVERPSDEDYLHRMFKDAVTEGYAIVTTRKVCQKMRVHGSNQFLQQRTNRAASLRKKLGIDLVN